MTLVILAMTCVVLLIIPHRKPLKKQGQTTANSTLSEVESSLATESKDWEKPTTQNARRPQSLTTFDMLIAEIKNRIANRKLPNFGYAYYHEQYKKAIEDLPWESSEARLLLNEKLCHDGLLFACYEVAFSLSENFFPTRFKDQKYTPKIKRAAEIFALTCLEMGAGCARSIRLSNAPADSKVIKQLTRFYCDSLYESTCSELANSIYDEHEAHQPSSDADWSLRDTQVIDVSERACASGNLASCYDIVHTGGNDPRIESAKEVYYYACDRGDMKACLSSSELLAEKDPEKSHQYSQRACAEKYDSGCMNLIVEKYSETRDIGKLTPQFKSLCDQLSMEFEENRKFCDDLTDGMTMDQQYLKKNFLLLTDGSSGTHGQSLWDLLNRTYRF